MDQPSLENLEQEIEDLQVHENETDAAKPSKYAQAVGERRRLLEKVKAF